MPTAIGVPLASLMKQCSTLPLPCRTILLYSKSGHNLRGNSTLGPFPPPSPYCSTSNEGVTTEPDFDAAQPLSDDEQLIINKPINKARI